MPNWANRLKAWFDYIQFLLDIDGDCWLGAFTFIVLVRLYMVLKGYAPLTNAESCAYGSAVASFAYSNKK
jgi:hypothetical protein